MNNNMSLRILMITPLDYEAAWNNREHNMARQYHGQGCDVTVVYKVTNRSKNKWQMLLDTITMTATRKHSEGLTFVRVDPLFNYYGGLGVNAAAEARSSASWFGIKYKLIRLLCSISFMREFFFIPCFLLATAIYLPGRYDVAVGFGPWGSIIAWFMKRFKKVSHFVYEDRDYEPGLMPPGLRYRYTAWLEKCMLRRADTVVSISRRLTQLRHSQVKRAINYIPTGVDWQQFAIARNGRQAGRTLIYVGNLVQWSGLEETINAMPVVLNAFSDTKLIIAGSGLPAYVEYLKELVRTLNIWHICQFAGQCDHEKIPQLLAQADIGLANSQPVEYRKYACPLKVLEYMAAGMAVIATEDTEAGDMVAHYQCGVVVPCKSEAIQMAICRLFNEPQQYQKMQENAVTRSEQLTWDRLMRQELELIRNEMK